MSGTAAATVKAVVNQRICNSGEFKVNSCYFFGHAFLIKRCDFSPPFCIVEEEGMTVLFWEQPMWPWVARVKILFWSRNPLTFFPSLSPPETSGWSQSGGALRPSVRQSEVCLCQKGENWRSRRQLWLVFSKCCVLFSWPSSSSVTQSFLVTIQIFFDF